MNLQNFFEKHAEKTALISGKRSYTYNELNTLCALKNKVFTEAGAEKNAIIALENNNSIDSAVDLLTCFIHGYSALVLNPNDRKSNQNILNNNSANLHIKNGKIVKLSDSIRFESSYLICFTSGTTGSPKGVCHTYSNIISNALAFNKESGINSKTRMLHIFPMSYMAGILNTLISPLVAGGTVVLSSPFSAEKVTDFWDDTIQYKCNTAWLTPTIISFVTSMTRNQETLDAIKAKLTTIFVGTAPLLYEKKQQFEAKFGIPCIESYGMSETLLVSANFEQMKNCVGKPLYGIITGTKTEGDLLLKSPFLFSGYLVNNVWCPPTLENAYFNSGDIAVLKGEQIFITGRAKDLIIKGGKNISPRFIEEKIIEHPDARDVSAVGVPHRFWGEDIVVFVETDQNDTDNFMDFCKEKIDKELLPSKVYFLKEFPRNSTGKVLKNKLREHI